MARQVNEVKQSGVPSLEPRARMADTYTRPAPPEEGQLESIAKALVSVQPSIARYLGKKDEEKKNFEMAVGVKIYKDLIAEGKDLPAEDIKQMVEKGEVEGFERLTKYNLEGIKRMRHSALADNLNLHMQTWSAKATITDEDGKAVPITSVQDQTKVMAAYEQEQARWIQEATAGQYDPVLYQEYVAKAEDAARNTFINQQAERVRSNIRAEQFKAASQMFDAVVAPFIVEGENGGNAFVLDRDNALGTMSSAFEDRFTMLRSQGLTEKEITQVTAQWFQSKFQEVDIDNIQNLLEVAQNLPSIINDPAVKEVLVRDARNAETNRAQLDWSREQRASNLAEARMADQITEWVHRPNGMKDVTDMEITKFLNDPQNIKYAGEYFTILNNLKKAHELSADMRMGMPAGDFNRVLIEALRGNVSLGQASAMANSLDPSQLNQLLTAVGKTASDRASGGASAVAIKSAELNEMERKIMNKLLGGTAEYNKLSPEEQDNIDTFMNEALLEASAKLSEMKQKDPGIAKDAMKKMTAITEVVKGMDLGRRREFISAYKAGTVSYRDNINEAAKADYTNTIKTYGSYLKPEAINDYKQFIKIMSDGGQPTKEWIRWFKKNVDKSKGVYVDDRRAEELLRDAGIAAQELNKLTGGDS